MKRIIAFIVFSMFSCITIGYGRNVYQNFDKAEFYTVIKSENLGDIDNELAKVSSASFKEKQAYEGALKMRKAGLLKKPADKLHTFKEGGRQLETAIDNDDTNAEYRFLRLIIQEHAPKILKYNKQLSTDKQFIIIHFKSLQPAVQQAVTEYAQSSKILRQQDFN